MSGSERDTRVETVKAIKRWPEQNKRAVQSFLPRWPEQYERMLRWRARSTGAAGPAAGPVQRFGGDGSQGARLRVIHQWAEASSF